MTAIDLKACTFPASLAKRTDRYLVVVERTIRYRKAIEVTGTDYVDEPEGRAWDARENAVREASEHGKLGNYGWTQLCIEHEAITDTLMAENVGGEDDHA